MVKRAIKNDLIEHFRVSVQDACKTGNKTLLYALRQNINEMLNYGENYVRRNTHLELGYVFSEMGQLADLYSQCLRSITKIENPQQLIIRRRNQF